jgi:N-carbamoyl-L-amino-acid hydrolase
MAGVALARAGLPVDAIAFADEEGHYGAFIGSRSFIGLLEEAEIDSLTNRYHHKPLRQALAEAGLAGRARITMDADRYQGFFEMHIEQGTTLENAGEHVGVVTGIVGNWQYHLVCVGQQDHAGGTTMVERRDAGLTAVRLLSAIDQEFPKHCGPRTVWTTGRITLEPGAAVLFQFRDTSAEILAQLDGVLRRLVQESNRRERCVTRVEVVSQSVPALCDAGLQSALAAAAEQIVPQKWRHMPSGAGHDAQYIARRLPAAMLFVPSIGGVSHHWTEDTSHEDLAIGLRVMTEAARLVLSAA